MITATLELELRRNSEAAAPVGALFTPAGSRRAFIGWLELASVIEEWRRSHEQAEQPDEQETTR
jgi:hypothetical protein